MHTAISFLLSYSVSNSNTNLAWLFELADGAIMDFEDTCVPKSQREASFTIAALHQWEMELRDDVRCVDSAKEVSVSLLLPSFITFKLFAYSNFLLQWISGTLKLVHVGGAFPSVSSQVLLFGPNSLTHI